MVFHEDRSTGQVQATVTVPECFRSYPGVVHGGVVATILDEVSGRAIMLATGDNNAFFVTAKMEVRYRHAAPVNIPLLAVGWVERMGQSRVWVRGELRLEDKVLAECRSLIVLPSPDFLAHWGEEESYWRVYSDEELQQAQLSGCAHLEGEGCPRSW
jgi:acyl-coenzyme A thioesterase PaaI-like protein